jgi:xylan 1,4-beta-xylosidase
MFYRALFLSASLLIIAVSTPSMARAQDSVRRISVDYSQVKGPTSQVFKQCVGAGRANEGLRADWQRQLIHAKRECDFQYIRMHGLFTDDMGVYREDKAGKPIYNWQYVDQLYDFLISVHVRPFVELGFMPNALASGTQTIFWWRGNVTPPKDYDKWRDLVAATLRHWTERYGRSEVSRWYFEVWNEPNLRGGFWTGSQQDYFKLYDVTAEAVKSVSPDYRVGGPATAGNAWITDFISHCADNHVPVDFVSTHTYGVNAGFLDENGGRGTVVSRDPNAVSGDMIRTRAQIDSSPLPRLPLFYTEWSASYTPADPIHDSYCEAAYILDKVKKAEPAVNGMSYWTFTDIFEEAGPRATPFHGGFGLTNYEDIDKPAFYAYWFLNSLGPTELVNQDPSSFVTRDAKGGVQALLWDFTVTNPGTVNDQVFYAKDQPAKPKGNVALSITHIPAGSYALRCTLVGYRANDPYDTYLDLGSPSQLTQPQVALIKAKNSGAPYETKTVTVARDGSFELSLPLRENDVYLITLTKLGK